MSHVTSATCNSLCRYTRGIALLRKCTKLPHIFPSIKLSLPLLSPLRLLPVALSALIVTFLLLDPSSYRTGLANLTSSRCLRSPIRNRYDLEQHTVTSAFIGIVTFALMLPFFNRAIVIVRLYRAHHAECSALLKIVFGRKQSPLPVLVFAGRPSEGVGGDDSPAQPYTARAYLEWEQAYSVLIYGRDGLNVLCAFQTSVLCVVFVACVALLVADSFSETTMPILGCSSSVVVIILTLATAIMLLPILLFAYLASAFEQDASYALQDLACQCTNIRARRDCAFACWDPSACEALNQRQLQKARVRNESALKQSVDGVCEHALLPVQQLPEVDAATAAAAMMALLIPVMLNPKP